MFTSKTVMTMQAVTFDRA